MNRLIASASLVLLLIAGCRPSMPAGGVAVVDLDAIAQAMGWTDQLNTQLQTAGRELQSQLEQVAQKARADVEKAKQEIITEAKLNEAQIALLNQIVDLRDLEKLPLNQQQREKLVNTLNQANLELQNARNNVHPVMQQHRLELVIGYRDKVQPIAKQVAEEKGLNVVLVQNDGILYFNADQVDITTEVIRRMRETTAPGGTAAPFLSGSPD